MRSFWKRVWWWRFGLLALLTLWALGEGEVSGLLLAQSTGQTAIADTVQYPNGAAAQGSILLSWPAFTTATGVAVPKGSTAVQLGASGALNVSLAPNVGGQPTGTVYTAVYHLLDGTVSREFWSVPVSGAPVKLAAVRAASLPLSVAVETVSKQYVDQAIARAALTGTVTGTGSGVDTTNASNITSGTLPVAQSPVITGDCEKAAGSATAVCTRTGGVPFAASATVDATNAANLLTGQLQPARMCGGTAAPGTFCDGGTRQWTAPTVPVTAAGVTGALGYTPAIPPAHLSGMLAWYDMLPAHISGSTVLDESGNGNHATLQAGAASTALGVQLTSNTGSIALPAALNAARTWQYAVDLPSLINNQPDGYPTLLGSVDSGGYQMFLLQSAGGTNFNAPYSLTLWVGGVATAVNVPIAAGRHVIVVTLGSSAGDPDRFYLDGVEFGSYTAQGYSAGRQTGSNLNLGAAGSFGGRTTTMVHTAYEFIARLAELSPTQVAAETAAMVGDMQARGLQWAPLSWQANGPYRIHVGDSITVGYGGTGDTGWTDPAVIHFAPTTPVFVRAPLAETAQIGITSAALLQSLPAALARYCHAAGGPNVVTLFNGTNTLAIGFGATPQSTARDLAAQVALVRQMGCVPFVGTMLSRTGSDPAGNTLDADHDALNGMIRSQAKLWGAAGVMDGAADPRLGADGAYSGSYFFDAIHPNDTGYALLAAAAARAIDYAFGYNEANPHVVTASSYTMDANDGAVDLEPSAATVVTLPSCIGQTGAVYRVNNPQNTWPVALKSADASQPMNGVDTSANGLTVPGNATVSLRDVANSGGAAGCHWEM